MYLGVQTHRHYPDHKCFGPYESNFESEPY